MPRRSNLSFEEAEAFLAGKISADKPRFDVDSLLFGKQRDFVRDPATFVTAVCSRRAGKSVGIASWLLEGPLISDAPSLYFTITRKEAKRIIWPVMLRLNREYGLGYTADNSELILKLNGIPMVYLQGVDTKDEIEKARGTGWGRVAGDEAQTLPQHVNDMIADVLMPSFIDYDGKLRIVGTPGAVPAGFFYDATQNPEWEHHQWTVWENPYLKGARAMLDKVLKVRGVKEDDPSIQREWWGRWVLDLNALVFQYNPNLNDYVSLPKTGEKWFYAVGIDLGFNDADAIAVLGWREGDRRTWLIEEYVQPKSDVTTLAAKATEIYDRLGHDRVLSMVVDAGGIGKKVSEELSARHKLPVHSAQKAEKQVHIELLNDAMRTGLFLAKKDSHFAKDAMMVEWDLDRTTPERRVVSDRFHSDITDAVLYAFRESIAWTTKVAEKKPEPGTIEAAEREAKAIREHVEREVQRDKDAKNDPFYAMDRLLLDEGQGEGWL